MPFTDLRGWITRLEKEGELRRITAQVDWDRELGAITRRVLEKKGPALLFDATRSWRFERRPEWGGARFPPTVRPAPEDEARVRARWNELGLGDLA